MQIREFGVEIWMNRHETECRYNLAETCVESLTLGELLALAGKTGAALDELLPMKLTYGAIEGSDRLREAIGSLYQSACRENVIITHGAIGANALIYETLVEPGDRVVSVLPTYQQHYSIPESYGADVRILRLRQADGFLPDPAELARLMNGRTKLISLSNLTRPSSVCWKRLHTQESVSRMASCCATQGMRDRLRINKSKERI